MEIEQTCAFYGIPLDKAMKHLSKEHLDIVLYGSKDVIHYKLKSSSGRIHETKKLFEGVINNLNRRYIETTSTWIRDWIEGFMSEKTCPVCHGQRLNTFSTFCKGW